MFARVLATSSRKVGVRSFSTGSQGVNVAVLGAAGGIGQPLSLLLKLTPGVASLRLADVNPAVAGVAADISHVNTSAKVTSHTKDTYKEALTGANIVVIPAGVPRKPGMTRDDLFNTNAGIIRDLAQAAAQYCPGAFILVITNPVNSTVPIVAETLKKAGVYDKHRLFGVTTLDHLRASTFVAELRPQDYTAEKLKLPVIGGHAGITILPILSGLTPKTPFTQDEIAKVTKRIQFGGDEVVQAKNGAGSATLSMAVAANNFATSVIKAINGSIVTETAYIESNVTSVPYFASSFELGPNGVSKLLPLPKFSGFEQEGYNALLADLQKNIDAGVKFAKQ